MMIAEFVDQIRPAWWRGEVVGNAVKLRAKQGKQDARWTSTTRADLADFINQSLVLFSVVEEGSR
jgi:hypothetical protein